jgi:hypothetical protein
MAFQRSLSGIKVHLAFPEREILLAESRKLIAESQFVESQNVPRGTFQRLQNNSHQQ